ncbi:hypothetical protein GQ42DRAFT_160632 [Ramicandelaber brevisporus]|nr:hypothetical protein GQ42DRAFT_160632 [Ramicandelaber brevisporus]
MQPQIKRARLDPALTAAVCQLFRLPRELLELVAAWFSRGEAVPALTVNSVFHEIFAERIWRCIDTYLADEKVIPLKSLPRYGHFVRRMRITELIPESVDLAAIFPNLTYLWISFYQLADIIEWSQGKCFERLNYLGTRLAHLDYYSSEYSIGIKPTLNWIDSRFEAEAGLEKVELEMDACDDIQLPCNFLKWFRSKGHLSRIQLKLDSEVLDINNIETAVLNKVIRHCLVNWKMQGDYQKCAARSFSNILDTIPSAVRQHFTFPALKKLNLGTCCIFGDNVYSQFNFGMMFPSVWDLTLGTMDTYCRDKPEATLSTVLAHPWPSVRKLNICGNFIFKHTIPYLATLSNVEELSMNQDDLNRDEEIEVVNLCELDRVLPKLVRLKIESDGAASASKNQQQQQQQEQQKLFRHLRYVTLAGLTMTSSAIDALVNAPLLTGICLEYLSIGNDDDVDISDQVYHRTDSAFNPDFLIGITNTTVRSMDIDADKDYLPENYEDILRAMIRCFTRMGVCIIRTDDGKALPGVLEEFPTVKFKRIE